MNVDGVRAVDRQSVAGAIHHDGSAKSAALARTRCVRTGRLHHIVDRSVELEHDCVTLTGSNGVGSKL